MTLLLLVILVLVLMGGIPAYSSGTLPFNSVLGVVLAIVLIMLLFGLLAPYVPYHRMW